jgi:sporulation protein YlmC with PRC-barrel domain
MRLSALLGRPVVGPDGSDLGRLADLAVSLEEAHPAVTALLVRHRGVVSRGSWSSVDALGPRAVELAAFPEPDGRRRPGELRLARDVLDAQIVDVAGKRLLRVGDVELAGRDHGLRVVGVDVSLAAVLRRLGLARVAGRGRAEAIDWSDIHLASAPGHGVQLDCPAAAVHRLGPRGLAAVVAALPPARGEELLQRVDPGRAAAARVTARSRRHRFPHRWRRRAQA